ncbi:hypothetical protein ASPWEDRAFT_44665 [Aspergillus wentii DTO 134E9]|uniref:Uncharacterized protein n=1 Tax=Aspergillus wentii DTO 134E9 TaxID=1073089 RepID=A0A1L9RC73_ASPWE|nr:uncharacterized protein ASPWEDRAFT_44665 [Aspergillus wentii DTO 134E9]OJJ32512.1 hypothetical protein ASPWEDRAFT_44665 [Aspergillus wentii DTO 134E9]
MHLYILFVILFSHYGFSSPLNETSTLSKESLSNSTDPFVMSPSNESGSTPSLPDSGDDNEANHPKTFIPPANTSTVQPPTLVQSQPVLLSSTTTSGHTASKTRPTILLSSTSTSYHTSTAPTADSNPPQKAPIQPTDLGKSCVCSCNWEVNTHITFDFR